MEFILVWGVFAVFAVVGALIGNSKNRVGAGAFWGFLLGPIGWIIVLLGPDYSKNAGAVAESGGGGAAAQLIDLKTLLDKGVITQQEFDEKKQKLLSCLGAVIRPSSSLPSGPDPAVIFRYVKWALAGVAALLAVWLVSSLVSGRSLKPAAVAAPAPPPVATQSAVGTRAVITALDAVRVQVWVKNQDNSYGDVVLPPTTLAKGETASFNKAGPVYIYASAQENIRIDFSGKQFTPSAPPHNVRGALAIELR